jgi:hypothetical protein
MGDIDDIKENFKKTHQNLIRILKLLETIEFNPIADKKSIDNALRLREIYINRLINQRDEINNLNIDKNVKNEILSIVSDKEMNDYMVIKTIIDAIPVFDTKHPQAVKQPPLNSRQVQLPPIERRNVSNSVAPTKSLTPAQPQKRFSTRVAPEPEPSLPSVPIVVPQRKSSRVAPEPEPLPPVPIVVPQSKSSRASSRVAPSQTLSPKQTLSPSQTLSPKQTLSPIKKRSPIVPPRKRDGFYKFMKFMKEGSKDLWKRLKIRMEGDKYKKIIEYIYYFDMRFEYFLKFLKNIFGILNLYAGILNPTQLNLINLMINEVVDIRCKWGNITLDKNALNNLLDVAKLNLPDIKALNSITLTDIRKKIFQQNTIIKKFLNAISAILTRYEETGFIKWLSSRKITGNINYLTAIKGINEKISTVKNTDDEVERGRRDDYVDYMLLREYPESITSVSQDTNKFPFYSEYPKIEYNKKKEEYLSSEHLFKDEPVNLEGINGKERERIEVTTIDLYRRPNILQFFYIVNSVLKYIEVVALYSNMKNSPNDKFIIEVANKIKAAIADSEEYKGVLIAYNGKNILYSDVENNAYIHQSIYLHFYNDLLKPYEGGSKRTVGRPRKTPAKPAKPTTKKPTPKPTKKPTTKPAKKPTKPTAKKPTKNK